MFSPPTTISLTLPTSYNRCTLPQLRTIATITLSLAQHADAYHPLLLDDIKSAAFFALTGLEIVAPLDTSLPLNEQFYLVRYKHNRIISFFDVIMRRNEPFPLYLWQVTSWLSKRKSPTGRVSPGMLDWLEPASSSPFVIFPFKEVRCRKGVFSSKVFQGPAPMLDGFSWQRYRFAQDFMKNYMEQNNYLVRLQQLGKRASAADIVKALKQVETAKALFLANLFTECIDYTDENTGLVRHDWHYQSNQATDNCDYFRSFSDVDWQIVLLWWSGIMSWLGHTYPKVFKVQSTSKNQQPTNPLELYARTTATIEKYVGLNAEEVEREPYTTVLQQMQDMAHQNEEMERIRASHK